LGIALWVVNLVGALAYLYAASSAWAIPEERAQWINSITGEPIVWFVRAVPILAGFSVLNFFWGAYICAKRRWPVGYFWLTSFALWIIALWIDFAHQLGRGGSEAPAYSAIFAVKDFGFFSSRFGFTTTSH
jgi:hypothetical protein